MSPRFLELEEGWRGRRQPWPYTSNEVLHECAGAGRACSRAEVTQASPAGLWGLIMK